MRYRITIIFPEQVFRHVAEDMETVNQVLDDFKNGNFSEIFSIDTNYTYDLSKAIGVYHEEMED